MTTVAGTGESGSKDGGVEVATFDYPVDIKVNPAEESR